MKKTPIASVVIPTYNYAHYIGEAIESVLASKLPKQDYEIIIIDDGSTDDTSEVIAQFRDSVVYLPIANAGKANATRVGIERSQGKYIFNLDADDLFLENKLEKVITVFEQNPSLVHVGHPAICWEVDTQIKSPESIPSQILNVKQDGIERLHFFYKAGLLFGGGSTFAARADVLKSIQIPRAVDMYIDEYLILATLVLGDTLLIDEPLSIWRIHGKNFSRSTSPDKSEDLQEISQAKLQKLSRITSSLDAVFSNLPPSLDQNFQTLYHLKISALKLALKENMNIKSWNDIFEHFNIILSAFYTLGLDTIPISQRYRVFERLLPTDIIRSLKVILKKNS
jgi:glycosyltransferase involved in cell wall biosynthesis